MDRSARACLRFARAWLALVCLAALAGCSRQEDRRSPQAGGPALYGELPAQPATLVPRARPFDPANDAWKRAPFAVVQTELSPATLFHCESDRLSFFTRLGDYGLGAPAYAAFGAQGGPRVAKNGEHLDAARMNECWVLVWFAGAAGWTNWDSPWAVFLQRKPTVMTLDGAGLHFEFTGPAGDVALLPLYGYFKPPPQDRDYLAEHGLPGKAIKTWQWPQVLTRDVLMRVRYWAGALREFPLYCEESFRVDRARDALTIRQRFVRHAIDDDWGTRPLKLAPVSPTLALAAKDKAFPVTFSQRVMDLDLFTPYGPYLAIEGVDEFDATLRLLHYVNETEAPALETAAGGQPAVPTNEIARAAWERLRQTAATLTLQRGEVDAQSALWLARSLPFLDADARSRAQAALRRWLSDTAGRDTAGAGARLLEPLWACAHFTGDREAVKAHWPRVRSFFDAPRHTGWAAFGGAATPAGGDDAAACLAFARLAWLAGAVDDYNHGCHQFARALTHQWARQRGADYFRRHQPGHSLEWMDEEVRLTSVRVDGSGWRMDGPNYPRGANEREHERRWVRFHNEDVARFHRDHLLADVRAELDRLTARWEPTRSWHDDPDAIPSLVHLRALLLNESPDALARLATPDRFTGPPAGVIASCLAVLRAGQSPRLVRLIPPGPPSPFVTGLERAVAGPSVQLVHALRHDADWPVVTWPAWKTPTGAPWSFGHVTPDRERGSFRARRVPLNWNTEAVIYTYPKTNSH
jgi:hypothetical protein